MATTKQLTEKQLLGILKQRVREAGTQKALAQKCGVSEQFLSDVLYGRRNITEPVLNGVGLRRVVRYEFIEKEK